MLALDIDGTLWIQPLATSYHQDTSAPHSGGSCGSGGSGSSVCGVGSSGGHGGGCGGASRSAPATAAGGGAGPMFQLWPLPDGAAVLGSGVAEALSAAAGNVYGMMWAPQGGSLLFLVVGPFCRWMVWTPPAGVAAEQQQAAHQPAPGGNASSMGSAGSSAPGCGSTTGSQSCGVDVPTSSSANAEAPIGPAGQLLLCAEHFPTPSFMHGLGPFMEQYKESMTLWSPEGDAFCFTASRVNGWQGDGGDDGACMRPRHGHVHGALHAAAPVTACFPPLTLPQAACLEMNPFFPQNDPPYSWVLLGALSLPLPPAAALLHQACVYLQSLQPAREGSPDGIAHAAQGQLSVAMAAPPQRLGPGSYAAWRPGGRAAAAQRA